MDPNEALRQLRECVEASEGVTQHDDNVDYFDLIESMTELFVGLDEWLTKGGFLPEAWNATTRENVGPELRRRPRAHRYAGMPAVPEPLGPPNPAGVELPEELRHRPSDPAVREAVAKLQSELTANADKIGKILSEED